MSQAATPQLVERAADVDDQERTDRPGLHKHDGVVEANRRAREDLPEWQRLRGDWWEADDDLTHGARERMTDRERQVWRSVEVHGMRPADLARETDADPSTIRTVLESAREKRGVQR